MKKQKTVLEELELFWPNLAGIKNQVKSAFKKISKC